MAIGMFFLSCENDIKEVERVTQHQDLPLQTIINSEIVYTDSAVTQFKVVAGQIDRYPHKEDPRDEFSNGIKVTTYNRSGGIESEIVAENATNYPERKIMIARDSVVLKSADGKMLQTELLTWEEESDRIHTDKYVTITTPTEILYGEGLEANTDFSEYEIKNIQGQITIDAEGSDQDSTQQTNPPMQ